MRRRRLIFLLTGLAAWALALPLALAVPAQALAAPAIDIPGPGHGAPVTIFVAGDVLLGRGVTANLNSHHTNLDRWKKSARACDAAFCNLECALGPPGLDRKGMHLQLVAPVEALKSIREGGFAVFSAANNHALDNGAAGARQLLRASKRLGLTPIGLQVGTPALYPAFIQTIHGRRLAWLAASEWGPFQSGDARIRPLAGTGLLNQVRDLAARGNTVLVSLHWGLEYQNEPTAGQRVTAHALIDAGAACVIGHHSHVAGPVEMYRGKPIFYGLGNFVFDAGKHHQSGLVARVTFGPHQITVKSWDVDGAPQAGSQPTATKQIGQPNAANGPISYKPNARKPISTTTAANATANAANGLASHKPAATRRTIPHPDAGTVQRVMPALPPGETLRQSLEGHLLSGSYHTQRLIWTQDKSGLHHLRAYLWREGGWHQIAAGTHQEIDRVELGDADGDGRDEIWLQLRQRSKLDIVPRPRLFLYDVDSQRGFRPRWRGSFLSRPFHEWTLIPSGKGGACDLAALETSSDPDYADFSWIDIYRWNGFGVARVWEAPLRGKVGGLRSQVDQTGQFLRFTQRPPQGQPIQWQVRVAPPDSSQPYLASRMDPK